MSEEEAAAAPTTEAPAPPPAVDEEILSIQTPSLGPLFGELGFSLVISTYQAGKLVIARKEGDVVGTHLVDSNRPMGVAVRQGQLAVGTTGEIHFYVDVPQNTAKMEPPGQHDACFVRRYTHNTGAIDIHEMAYGDDGQIWFINTRFSTLCSIQGTPSFIPAWRPPFVTELIAEDRCHLNGLGMMNGKPRYVTMLGATNTKGGWRENKKDGGLLMDLATQRVLCSGLSMPHSPRWYANRLWVCESGKGTLSTVDYASGEVRPFFEFPGFTRGLDFFGPLAFVGLSKVRESATFSGLPIQEKGEALNSGVWVVDITNGKLMGILRFTQGVHEVFAVQVLPGLRYPALLKPEDKLSLETYFLPPDAARIAR